MSKKTVLDAIGVVVGELTPFSAEDRQRIVQASLTVLGEPVSANFDGDNAAVVGQGDGGLSVRAKTWMKQNEISLDQLNQVFLLGNGETEIIVSQIPGKNNREKVRNAYVLLGVARLLTAGEAKFDDKDARAVCENFGVYDQTNHMKYMKGGNEFAGAKDKGWILTAPGLKHAAILIKGLAQ